MCSFLCCLLHLEEPPQKTASSSYKPLPSAVRTAKRKVTLLIDSIYITCENTLQHWCLVFDLSPASTHCVCGVQCLQVGANTLYGGPWLGLHGMMKIRVVTVRCTYQTLQRVKVLLYYWLWSDVLRTRSRTTNQNSLPYAEQTFGCSSLSSKNICKHILLFYWITKQFWWSASHH